MIEADYQLRVYTLEHVVHAPGWVKRTVPVLQYFVLENNLSVMTGRKKGNVYDNDDNAKEKGGT